MAIVLTQLSDRTSAPERIRTSQKSPKGVVVGVGELGRERDAHRAAVQLPETMPYACATSIALQSDVNDSAALSTTTKTAVTSSLTGGCGKLTKRDFVGATSALAAAATTLRSASADPSLQDTADWIGHARLLAGGALGRRPNTAAARISRRGPDPPLAAVAVAEDPRSKALAARGPPRLR
jgi:hypothetical protein